MLPRRLVQAEDVVVVAPDVVEVPRVKLFTLPGLRDVERLGEHEVPSESGVGGLVGVHLILEFRCARGDFGVDGGFHLSRRKSQHGHDGPPHVAVPCARGLASEE